MPTIIKEADLFGEEEVTAPWSTRDEEELILDPMVPWTKSMVTEAKLQAMVEAGALPPKEVIGWRAVDGEVFPTPNTGKIIVHAPFFFRWFSIQVHPFLHSLLYFYGLELHNLNPNGILHVACFITLF